MDREGRFIRIGTGAVPMELGMAPVDSVFLSLQQKKQQRIENADESNLQ